MQPGETLYGFGNVPEGTRIALYDGRLRLVREIEHEGGVFAEPLLITGDEIVMTAVPGDDRCDELPLIWRPSKTIKLHRCRRFRALWRRLRPMAY